MWVLQSRAGSAGRGGLSPGQRVLPTATTPELLILFSPCSTHRETWYPNTGIPGVPKGRQQWGDACSSPGSAPGTLSWLTQTPH